MSDVGALKKEIEISHGGEIFVFRIPSVMDKVRSGVAARRIRAAADPSAGGQPNGLDGETYFLVQAIATIETMLLRGPAWIFSEGEKGAPPVIDPEKWPTERVDDIIPIVDKFEEEYARFRKGGSANGQSSADEVVHGREDLR